MRRGKRPQAALGIIVACTLLGVGATPAQSQHKPGATVAEQRRWLVQQIRIGQASGRTGLVDDALARLRMIAPGDPASLYAVYEVQMERGMHDDALATLNQLRRTAAGSRELDSAERLWRVTRGDQRDALQQARTLAAGGRNAEAIAIYERLFGQRPPNVRLAVEYWRLRGADPAGRSLAIARLTELDRQYPDDSALQLVLQRLRDDAREGAGTAAADGDDGASAREEARRRAADPSWRAWTRGQRHYDAGRYAQAEQEYRQALRGRPNEAEFIGSLGMARMNQGQREEAIALYQRALRNLKPGEGGQKWRDLIASTRYWLGLQHADEALQAGEVERAATLYGAANRQRPREVNAMLGLSDVALARNDDATAERWLLAARRADPADANAVRKLVALYARTDPQRMEVLINGLPPNLRARHVDDLRQLRVVRLQASLEQARADGDGPRAIALARELRREQPGDPWVAYRMASDLRAAGEAGEADAAMADMLTHAGDNPDAHYAHALYLSSLDRGDDALAALAKVPQADWSEGMRELDTRLQRARTLARLRALREAGHEAEATAELERQAPSIDNHLLLAQWAGERGDHAAALGWYERVLAESADNTEARLGQLEAWIALGRHSAARDALAGMASAIEGRGQQKRMADIWAALGENDKALAVLRQLIATQDAPDAQLYRDSARLLRRDDPQAALDLYALGMRDAGLLDAAQASPRDDRALTFASRAQEQDDWLRRSLRSDVDALYQAQNPTLTLMQDSSRRSDGTPGISELSRDTRMAHLQMPFVGGIGWARLEQLALDAGTFVTGADGGHRQAFATCDLRLVRADGSAFAVESCQRDLHQQRNTGAGAAIGWSSDDGRLTMDIGHSPAGVPVGNWWGGIGYGGDIGVLGWSATLSRRPMTNSLLSHAGIHDPRSGIRWGGVTANGLTVSLGYDKGGRNGVWSNWSWHRLSGENIPDNDRLRAMGGWYHRVIDRTNMQLSVGLSAMYWRFAKDLGGYTLGQGGYWSPQRWVSLGVPVSFAWRNDNWSLRLEGSVSTSRSRTDASSRYPHAASLQRVIDQYAANAGEPLFLDPAYAAVAGGSGSGTGHRLYGAVERRLSDHWVLGAAATLQRSQDYSPNSFQLYLRYVFRPWQGNLPMPVSPLQPYGEFR